jgi:putative tricarboxylic transport membrane protein
MNARSKLTGRQKADLCILTVLGGVALLYLYDTYQASHHIYNLIFVAPLCLVVFALCLIEFIGQLRGRLEPPADLEPLSSVAPAIGLFTLYVVSLNWVGFDVGTALFAGSFLWLHGERRWPWLLGYPIAFALLTTLFFSSMLPYPMPMLIFSTEY